MPEEPEDEETEEEIPETINDVFRVDQQALLAEDDQFPWEIEDNPLNSVNTGWTGILKGGLNTIWDDYQDAKRAEEMAKLMGGELIRGDEGQYLIRRERTPDEQYQYDRLDYLAGNTESDLEATQYEWDARKEIADKELAGILADAEAKTYYSDMIGAGMLANANKNVTMNYTGNVGGDEESDEFGEGWLEELWLEGDDEEEEE